MYIKVNTIIRVRGTLRQYVVTYDYYEIELFTLLSNLNFSKVYYLFQITLKSKIIQIVTEQETIIYENYMQSESAHSGQ